MFFMPPANSDGSYLMLDFGFAASHAEAAAISPCEAFDAGLPGTITSITPFRFDGINRLTSRERA